MRIVSSESSDVDDTNNVKPGYLIEIPKSIEDVYKYQIESIKRLQHMPKEKMRSPADIAEVIIPMSMTTFEELLVLEHEKENSSGPSSYSMYLPKYCGIWQKQYSTSQLIRTIRTIQDRIYNQVIKRLNIALQQVRIADRLKGNGSVTSTEKSQAEKKVEGHIKLLQKLYIDLGTMSYINSVISFIILVRKEHTQNMGYTLNMFDCVQDHNVIVFKDGLYEFNKRQFMQGKAAQSLFMTEAVALDVSYEDLQTMSKDCDEYKECLQFLCKIFGKEHMRNYIMKILSLSIRLKGIKRFFIHYNISGDNGKTTFFNLVKTVLGSLFTRCNNALLYANTQVNPNQSNEELMSIKNKAVVLFSEPSQKQKLNISFIKDLTGADDQTARHNYGAKQSFKFLGSTHMLCNRIPQLEGIDGGVQTRLRCIPYESRFVADVNEVDTSKNIYMLDPNVSINFTRWKLAFIYMLMEMQDIPLIEPEEVKEHTKNLMERDNLIKAYIEDRLVEGSSESILTSKQIYQDYLSYCRDNNISDHVKRDVLETDITTQMRTPFILRNKTHRRFWKGIAFNEESTPSVNNYIIYDDT